MNRPYTSSKTQRTKPTLRVLGRLPYVASSPEESTMVSDPAPAPEKGLFDLTDPIKRGLLLGVGVVAILGVTWVFIGRKSSKTELANRDSTPAWEVQTPRPDAPEAPAWNPNEVASQSPVQLAQAQASPGFDGLFSYPTSETKSPLGFDLPPGNGWGEPLSQENTPVYPPNAAGSPGSWQQPTVGQPLPSSQAQTSFEAVPELGIASPLVNRPVLQASAPAPVPPWVNAAGQPGAAQPAGFVAEDYSPVPVQPVAQSGMPSSPGVLHNPYVGDPNPAVSEAYPNPANSPAYPVTSVNAFSNSGQFSSSGTGQRGYERSPASVWSTTRSQQPAQPAEAYFASRPGNQWATPAPSTSHNPSHAWQLNPAYPNAPQSPVANWDQPNQLGNTPPAPAGASQPGVVANSGVPSPRYPQATYPQGNWNLPGGQQPANWGNVPVVSPAAPASNVAPGQPAQTPSYPATPNPLSPADRSNALPATTGDSQVVPATYARPTPPSPPASQGWSPAGAYPSTGTTASGVSAAPSQYPSTGQTGYGLYPATTVR
ncbi:MAG: hypothetical protein ACUVQG_04100 [Thermogutta sp.]